MRKDKEDHRRQKFLKYLLTASLCISFVCAGLFVHAEAATEPALIPLDVGKGAEEKNIPLEEWDSDAFILYTIKKMKKEGKIPPGAKISLLVCEGTTAQIDWLKPIWKEVSGMDVEYITVPLYDLSVKLMAESVSKSGVYDAMIYPGEYIGDAVESGLVMDMSPWIKKYHYNIDKWPCPFTGGTFQNQVMYMGKPYQLLWDGCIWTPFYRSDLLDDPKEQAAFAKKYGYPLPQWGADTWKQLGDMMEFFNRPDMVQTLPDGSKLKGLKGGWWFRTKDEIGDVFLIKMVSRGGKYFHDNGDAAIDSPEGIAALEELKKETKYIPDVAVTGSWTEMYADFPAGKTFSAFSWTSLGKFAALGAIRGRYKMGKVPGTLVKGKIRRVTMRRGTLSWAVSKYGKNPELTFLFMAYMTSPRISSIAVSKTGYWDPVRECHFTYPPILEIYGSKEVGVEQTQQSLFNNRFCQTVAMPNLLIPRYEEYRENLASACHGYVTGTIESAEKALKQAAKKWNRITKSVGREKIVKRWNALKPQFPELIRELHGW